MDYQRIDSFIDQLVASSTPTRTAWNVEKANAKKVSTWNYIDGCMLNALLELSAIESKPQYRDFVEQVADHCIADDGSVIGYRTQEHALDDINEGRIVFALHELFHKEKYRLCADFLYAQLQEQPRTSEGNFWHKERYPEQVWLDGIYMAMPFLALYAKDFQNGDYDDILQQLHQVAVHMKDPVTGLYYHGYDSSRSIFWADKETGLSKNFWLRAIGWFSVALADLLEIIPTEKTAELQQIFSDLMHSIAAFADEETGMYWQVPNMPGREGNYLETSGSCMIAYAMLKGARLGYLPEEYAVLGEKTFHGIMEKYLTYEDGQLCLGGICLVAGLGVAPNSQRARDGSYEYYISEPVVRNDAKGVAPFVLCYSEILRKQ